MSFTNCQSLQDLDQNEFLIERNLDTPQLWCQKDILSQISSIQHLQSSIRTPDLIHQQLSTNHTPQNHKQILKENQINLQQTFYIINNQNFCNDDNRIASKHSNQQQQPCIDRKINAKLLSIDDLLVSKDEQSMYPYYDSGSEIFNDVQTHSNSFQSDNQNSSVSNNIKKNNKTISACYQNIETQPNLQLEYRQIHQKIGHPFPSYQKNSESYVNQSFPQLISSTSSSYLYPPTILHDREFNEKYFSFPQNLDHQAKNTIIPYQDETEYFYNYQVADKHAQSEIQSIQKTYSQINNQNASQDKKIEQLIEQVSVKNFIGNDELTQISKHYKNNQYYHENVNSYKFLENTYSDDKIDNFQYYSFREQKKIELIQNQELISFCEVNDLYKYQSPDIQQSECQKQNHFGNLYQNSSFFQTSAPLQTSLKCDEDRELQNFSQGNELNNQYEQNNTHYYNEQNNYNTSNYPLYQYDPDTFFNQDPISESLQQDVKFTYEQGLDHISNRQIQEQQEQISNSIITNLNNEKKTAYSNIKLNVGQIDVFEKSHENSLTLSNDKNNASLIISSIQNTSEINQNPLINLQSKLKSQSDQEIIGHDQIILSLQLQSNINSQFQQNDLTYQSYVNNQQQQNQNDLLSEQIISQIQNIESSVSINYNQETNEKNTTIFSKRKSTHTYVNPQHQLQTSSSQTNSKIGSSQSEGVISTNGFSNSPSIKQKQSASLRLTPIKQLNENLNQNNRADLSSYFEEDEAEKELSLKFEQINLKKKISIDTQSFEDEGETINKEEQDFKDSSENSSLNQLIELTQNKKNVVKNLMSAFKSFILSWGDKQAIEQIYNISNEDCEEIDDIQRKFKRYIDSKSFNHYSLRLLILHVNYGPIFKYFLSQHSLLWLENSKIKDIESHQKMIQFFLSCFDDIKIIDNLRRHPKKKCRFS